MKNILVTGANRGLGLEFVRQLAAGFSSETSNIFATCRAPENAEELEEIKKTSKVNVHIIKLDVANESQVKNLPIVLKEILGPEDGLNVLINNAGILKIYNESMAKHDLKELFNINVIAPCMITQSLLPLLRLAANNQVSPEGGKSASRAVVLSISSITGSFQFTPPSWRGSSFLAYNASYAGLNMIMRGIGTAIGKDGILMIMIHPGWVSTDMGGEEAPITPPDSVASMLKTLKTATQEHHGKFIDKDGIIIEW